MGIALATFVALFLLLLSAGLLLFYRDAMLRRLGNVVRGEQESPSMVRRFAGASSNVSLGAMAQPFERFLPRSAEEASVVRTRLIRAGYRQDTYTQIFYGAKVLVPLSLIGLITITGLYEVGAFFIYVLSAGLGFLVPDFWLGHLISKRQTNVRFGLPDALDLMVICIEAGLSVDQATMKVVEEMSHAHPDICDELGLVILEQRAGRGRAEAWKAMADRVDLEPIRALATIIIQADQFGTSISKGLRIHSEMLRTTRRQKAEEKAAKTTVKLVFPLVLFIFPSLFVVTLGPAMITIKESFEKYFSGN